jgi:hypothetical protein
MTKKRRPQPRPRRRFFAPGGDIEVTATGVRIESGGIPRTRFPRLVSGQHCWHVIGAWRVADPEATQQILDVENLINVTPPMCLWCERPYSRELAAEPCPGDVSKGWSPS